jgi:hypothetical protein
METVLDNVTDGLTDAGELVMDAVLGSDDGSGGGRLRRAVLGLLLIGAIIGIVLWRKSQAREDAQAAASA